MPRRPAARPVRREPDDAALLASVARRYYVDDESKVSIAEGLGVSRFHVARLLREARDRGLVTIAISTGGLVDGDLGAALQDHLGVRRAVVVAAVPDQTSAVVVRNLGRVLADLLSTEVVEDEVLGLAWSRVEASMVEQLASIERCTVVQLAGHLLVEGETSSGIELVRRTAALGGGAAYPIYAPMVVDDAVSAAALRRSPEVAHALARADHLDRAVVSIGAWGSSRSRVFRRLSPEVQQRGVDLGAVGEISGRVFDDSGALLPEILDDRVVAATLDQIRSTPTVVATSWGAESAGAVATVSRVGWVDTLVVDESLARALLSARAR
ncbi:sugar-binding domain-containing protein [Pseudokineococcus basanitobsidens]|uniref:Sugar-binding domain-containing protein n=1 Tax=Pseudokineococcus basanitobsidens TaxID=1926649 RepID=A0ABU8RND6_9ACTN